jgi:hypothetical protein
MNKSDDILPPARTDKLITQQLDGELLVYDERTDRAHCLNPSAAMVWKHCDGRTSVGQMAGLLRRDAGSDVPEQVVWLALEQLEKFDLLEAPRKATSERRISRRELARTLGIAAALALPLVTSIVAPTAAHAASCAGAGQPCASRACCPGFNCNGTICQAS